MVLLPFTSLDSWILEPWLLEKQHHILDGDSDNIWIVT